MKTILEVVCSFAFVGSFAFMGVVRWLNSKLVGNWFYDQR